MEIKEIRGWEDAGSLREELINRKKWCKEGRKGEKRTGVEEREIRRWEATGRLRERG